MSTSSSASSKSSSASRSSAATAASRPAATPSAPKPATTRPADKKSCHLAEPTQTQKLRGDLDTFARQHPSSYSTQVQTVNKAMQALGIGISPCSHQSIKDSLKGVSQGTMTEKQAHAREAESFARDSFESHAHGRTVQGTMERVGSELNAVAAQVLDGFDRISNRFSPAPASTLSTPRSGFSGGGGDAGGGGATGTW
jgi:hypothetical protein